MVDNNDSSSDSGGIERNYAQDDDVCNKSSPSINSEKVAEEVTGRQGKSALTTATDPPNGSSICNNTGNRSTRNKSVGNAISKYNHQSPTRQKTLIDPMKASMTSLDCPSYLFSSTKQDASTSASNNHSIRSTLPLLSSSIKNSGIEGEEIATKKDQKGGNQHRTRKVPSTFLGSFRDSGSTTTSSSPQQVQQEQQQQPTTQRAKSRLRERHSEASGVDDETTILQLVDNQHQSSFRRSGTGISRATLNETNTKSILRQHRRNRDVTTPSSATPTTSGKSEISAKEPNTLEADKAQPTVTNLPTKIEEQKLEATENPPDHTSSTTSRSRVMTHPRRVRSIRSNNGNSQPRNSDAINTYSHEGSNASLDLNDALSRDPSSATESSPETVKPMPQQRLRSSKTSVTSRNGNISTNTTRQHHKSPMRQRLQHNNHGSKAGSSNNTSAAVTAAATKSMASSATSMSYPKSPSTGIRNNKKHTKDMSNTSLTKLSLLQKLQDLSDKTQIDCNSSIAW